MGMVSMELKADFETEIQFILKDNILVDELLATNLGRSDVLGSEATLAYR